MELGRFCVGALVRVAAGEITVRVMGAVGLFWGLGHLFTLNCTWAWAEIKVI